MKTGIMQPYFLPYLGYWQLLAMVDQYVILDDVNYINRGWINRNRILAGGKPTYITIPLVKASQNKHINEIKLFEQKINFDKLLKTVYLHYRKATQFDAIFSLLEEIVSYKGDDLAGFLVYSIQVICRYLGIHTKLLLSSEIEKKDSLHAQDRIMWICKYLQTDEYINAIGGQKLYSKEIFEKNGIKLYFLQSDLPAYHQFAKEFVPGLSILDVLMFNSQETVMGMLQNYTLL